MDIAGHVMLLRASLGRIVGSFLAGQQRIESIVRQTLHDGRRRLPQTLFGREFAV